MMNKWKRLTECLLRFLKETPNENDPVLNHIYWCICLALDYPATQNMYAVFADTGYRSFFPSEFYLLIKGTSHKN